MAIRPDRIHTRMPAQDALPALLQPQPRSGMPAVFFDKDGTLVDDVAYNVDPSRMHLARGTSDALSRLADLRILLVVISNQPGVARGYFSEAELEPVRQHMAALFAQRGARLSGFYYCPHDAESSQAIPCDCRKPAAGLLYRAARELGIDLHRSWMVGDILDDVAAGNRAGCRTILVDNCNETEWRLDSPLRRPDHIVADMSEAAERIVSYSNAQSQRCAERPS